MNGKYGPYVKCGKVNVSLPDGQKPEEFTLAGAIEWLKAKIGEATPGKKEKNDKTEKKLKKKKPQQKVSQKAAKNDHTQKPQTKVETKVGAKIGVKNEPKVETKKPVNAVKKNSARKRPALSR